MNLKKLKNNKKGFTLIEIIVVVVILAVLMAVAVPAVLSYLDEADDAKFETTGRAVYTAVQTEWAKDYADGNLVDGKPVAPATVAQKAIDRVMGEGDNIDNLSDITIYVKDGSGYKAATGNEKAITKVVAKVTINGTEKTVTITGNKTVEVS